MKPVIVLAVLGFAVVTSVGEAVRPASAGTSESPRQESPVQLFSEDVQRLPVNRESLVLIETLREQVGQSDWNGVRLTLDRLLQVPYSELMPTSDRTAIPACRYVLRELAALPDQVRAEHRTENGPISQARIEEAIRSGDLSKVREAAFRYSGTDASHRAFRLLQAVHRNRGNEQAERWWQGVVDESARTLGRQIPADSATIGIPQPAVSTVRAASTGPDDAKRPFISIWSKPVPFRADMSETWELLKELGLNARIVPPVEWQPSIQGDTAVLRTLRGVTAIDLRSGSDLWHYTTLPTAEEQIKDSGSSRVASSRSSQSAIRTESQKPLVQLICCNSVYGQLQCDAQRVYVIEQLTHLADVGITNAGIMMARRQLETPDYSNELSALDLNSGQRLWSLGGPPREVQFGNGLSNAWMMGVPALHGGRLLGLCELNNAIQLYSVRSDTGEVEWQFPLAYPSLGVGIDLQRSQWRATVAIQGDLAFCSTTAGWMVAVDTVTRTPLWAGAVTQPSAQGRTGRVSRFTPRIVGTSAVGLNDRWPSTEPVLAGNRLIVAPPERKAVLILDAVTGEELDRIESPGTLRVLHADPRRIVLALTTGLEAYDTTTAKHVWSVPFDPVRGLPAGAGYTDGTLLTVPSTGGRLVTVDLESGGVVSDQPIPVARPFVGAVLQRSGVLIATAPDQVTRFVNSPSEADRPGDRFRAEGLLLTEQYRQLLNEFGDSSGHGLAPDSVVEFRQKALQAILQRGLEHDLADIDEFERLGSTDEQSLLSAAFRLVHAVRNGDQEQAATALELFQRRQTETALRIRPDRRNRRDELLSLPYIRATAERQTPGQSRKVRADIWLDGLLSEAASLQHSGNDFNSESAQQTGDSIGGAIRLRHGCQDYIADAAAAHDQGRFDEELLRLSLAFHIAAEENDVDQQDAVFQQIRELTDFLAGEDDVVCRILLDSLQYDLAGYAAASDADSAFRLIDALPDSRLDLANTMSNRWSIWDRERTQIVPVAQSSYRSAVEQEIPCNDAGSPYGRWIEAVYQQRSGKIHFDPIPTDLDGWMAPLTEPSGRSRVTRSIPRKVIRSGHLLYVRCSDRIVCYSVVSRQQLWSRPLKNADDSTNETRPTVSFSRFDRASASVNGHPLTDPAIVGVGNGWLGVSDNGVLSVLDSLTGLPRWSVRGVNDDTQCVACDSCVYVSDPNLTQLRVYRTADGELLQTSLDRSRIGRIVLAVGSQLIELRNEKNEDGTLLIRIDAATERELSRSRIVSSGKLQLLDSRRVFRLNPPEEFGVIDLLTGETTQFELPRLSDSGQIIPFGLPSDTSSEDPPRTLESDAVTEPGDEASGDKADREREAASQESDTMSPAETWKTSDDEFIQKLAVFEDSINTYVTFATGPQVTLLQNQGLSPVRESVDRGLFALNSQDGKLLWAREIQEHTMMFRDVRAAPFLLLLAPRRSTRRVGLVEDQPILLLHKQSGRVLTDQVISSRQPLSFQGIRRNRDTSIDMWIHTNWLRVHPGERN